MIGSRLAGCWLHKGTFLDWSGHDLRASTAVDLSWQLKRSLDMTAPFYNNVSWHSFSCQSDKYFCKLVTYGHFWRIRMVTWGHWWCFMLTSGVLVRQVSSPTSASPRSLYFCHFLIQEPGRSLGATSVDWWVASMSPKSCSIHSEHDDMIILYYPYLIWLLDCPLCTSLSIWPIIKDYYHE